MLQKILGAFKQILKRVLSRKLAPTKNMYTIVIRANVFCCLFTSDVLMGLKVVTPTPSRGGDRGYGGPEDMSQEEITSGGQKRDTPNILTISDLRLIFWNLLL